ncbi:putative RNA-directed DNA polymerase [Tanacetum coccineum]
MSNIKKFKFPALEITGENYIQRIGYVKRHLKSMGALETIQEGNKYTKDVKAKANVFLHQHIDEMLEFEYSSYDDPSILWKELEVRFNIQKEVLLPSARDEWNNLRYDAQSRTIGNKKYLLIMDENQAFETLPMLHSGLHYTHINVPHAHMAVKEKYYDPSIFHLWNDRLGHPGSTMMKRIVENAHGHPLKDQKLSKIDKVPLCISCSLRKLIVRPSPLKIGNESPMFFERIQGNICGLIHPPYGPFRYFIVLIDASNRWSHVSLYVALAKFLAQIIKLRAHFPDYTIERVRLDNAGEFTSHTFNDYCMSVGIVVEHSVAHVHTQNGLAESLIKRLQLIARPLIMRTKLHVSIVCTHCTTTTDKNGSSKEIVNLSVFPELGGVKKNQGKDVIWSEPSLLYLDPRTKQCENEVQKIMNLQEIANQLPDAFTDTKRVTKPHIPAAIPNKQADDNIGQENEKNEVTRYKAQLVAQGFSQRPGIDYEETYSPVMDTITFRYLISLAVSKNLEMHLMDVVTAYLYGSIDNDIYMKILKGFKIPESLSSKPKEMYSIKLQRSLYGLKQSRRMWYNRLSDYLISKGYKSTLICPCVFIKKTTYGFVIIVVYVDDLNIISIHKEINEVIVHLKEEFEMKDLGKTNNINLGLQSSTCLPSYLCINEFYKEKVLKCFNMDKAKSLSTLMVGRSLNVDNDPFRPCEEDEDILGPKTSYLSAIGVLILISQSGYVDLNKGIAISWRSQKQTLVATSSNHAKVIALHEASRECVWLRSMTQLIVTSCGLNKREVSIFIYEANAACVTQMKESYIKSDRTKHIPPRYFAYTQDLIKDNQIEKKYVQSSNNSVDLFTKSLPTSVFRKHIHAIGMRHVQKT